MQGASGCPSQGVGTIGAPDGTGVTWYQGNHHGLYAHELGHNLGMRHANGMVCRDHAGNYLSNSGQCNVEEYHDNMDVMGWYGPTRHFSSHRKSQLGWLSPNNIREVQESGQFTIVPQETASSGIQSLLIPSENSDFSYHLEVRQSIGFDEGLSKTVLLRKSHPIHWSRNRSPRFISRESS